VVIRSREHLKVLHWSHEGLWMVESQVDDLEECINISSAPCDAKSSAKNPIIRKGSCVDNHLAAVYNDLFVDL
jgi:hypothetical protein